MIKKAADWIFKWYCHPDYYPDIKGDLEEMHTDRLERSIRFSQLKYLVDVVLLFRLSLLAPITTKTTIMNGGMFRNYFNITVRNLIRYKMFTTINVVGLGIGLASFLLIYEYIDFEKSYDSFHNDADQLHRVSNVQVINGIDGGKDAMASYLTGKVLNEELPEVLQHTVSKKFDEMMVRNGDVFFKEQHIITADSNFLNLFNYEVIHGSKETMLNEPRSVVLTESKARAYFGSTDPIGKTLEIFSEMKLSLNVTGVIQDLPDNTHYTFDILISDKTLEGGFDYGNWSYNNYYVYIKTSNGVDLKQLSEKANKVAFKFLNGEDPDESNLTRLDIHPVQDIHLKTDFTYEPQIHGSEKAVNFLVIISIFILVIAWVNYVNLSTARAVQRAKEVGIRKVVGAFRKQLIFQFLFEAFMVNLISAFIALMLAEVSLPFFNQLVGKQIIDHVWNYLPFLKSLLIFSIVGALASGFYPAIVLSNLRPITVLKGKFINTNRGTMLRKALVVTQFAASLILIATTFTIYLQINYMKEKDIGISIDYVVNVMVPEETFDSDNEKEAYNEKLKAFKEALRNHSAIEGVGGASNLPGGEAADINATSTVVRLVGLTDRLKGTTYIQYNDEGFFDAVDMQLIAGRNFDSNRQSDSSAVMVNESFLRKFNQPDIQALVNEKIQFGRSEDRSIFNIVGIVKDFNRTSLKSEVEPTVYLQWSDADNLVIELNPINYASGLEHFDEVWNEFYGKVPYEFTFLDDRFAALYKQDEKFGDTFLVFSSLAILIAILGLFGLSSFMSIQRSKEVGVRKVLGASRTQIITIFYKDFMILIGISAFVGLPAVYILMNSWLSNYAHRIDFPWLVLIAALVVVLIFALATVGYHTAKVASINPARTLKYE